MNAQTIIKKRCMPGNLDKARTGRSGTL